MLQHLHIYAQGLNRHPARYLRGTADPAPYPFSVACLGCNGKPSPGPDGVHSAMAFNQKDGDVKPGLQFVIDGPCLNNDKAKIRTLVRSNASRYYWRERQQTRARTAVTKKGKNAENSRPMNLSSESLNRATPNLPPKNDESFTAILQTTGRYPQLSFNFNPRDTTADAPLDEEMPNQYFGWRWSHQEGYPGALSLLGAGKVDPFWSYPSALPRSVVGELMTYAAECCVPHIAPLRVSTPGPRWLTQALTSRALFHACVFSAALHSRACRGLPIKPDTPELMICYIEAIHYLNKDLVDPETACSDANLFAIMCLSTFGLNGAPEKPARWPAQGPLKGLQCLDSYGKFETVQPHVEGLARLLEMRGGIGTIKLESVAETISYAGLIIATRNLRKPPYPFIPQLKGSQPTINLLRDVGPENHLELLGTGFHGLWNESCASYINEFLDVVQDICRYTQLVNEYVEGGMVHVHLSETIDLRNSTQHKVLSIPTRDAIKADPNFEAIESMYETCRLATHIFSLLIVFPIPPETAPFALLAAKLRMELSACTLFGDGAMPGQPLLWILVMGGIAAIDTPDRSWFVYIIGIVMASMGLSEWEDVRNILQHFLWLEGVSGRDGRMLLSEFVSRSILM